MLLNFKDIIVPLELFYLINILAISDFLIIKLEEKAKTTVRLVSVVTTVPVLL